VKYLAYKFVDCLVAAAGNLLPLTTMAEQADQIDSDTASTNNWSWDDISATSSEPSLGPGRVVLSATPSPRRALPKKGSRSSGQAARGRYKTALPLESEKALIKVLLNRVL
jgi:hypothetical protein